MSATANTYAASVTEAEFEAEVKQLVGLRLERVRYFELAGGWPAWDEYRAYDTLDFGLDLISEAGTFSVTWSSQFWSYGLRVQRGSLVDQLLQATFTDVTTESRWSAMIGLTITTVEVYWRTVPVLEFGSGPRYPQDLGVTFESGEQVFLSAAQPWEGHEALWGMSDNVAVVFGEEAARSLRVGPDAPLA